MSDDPWANPDPETLAWMDRVIEELIPMMRSSAIVVSIVPDDPTRTDVKLAVELGLAIMLGKPIIAVVRPGTRLPAGLARVAEDIVEADTDAGDMSALAAALERAALRAAQRRHGP